MANSIIKPRLNPNSNLLRPNRKQTKTIFINCYFNLAAHIIMEYLSPKAF